MDGVFETKEKEISAGYNKGVVLGRLKRYKHAIEAYERSVILNPQKALPYSNLAELFFNLCNYKKASEMIYEVLTRNENFKIEEKKYDEAIGFFDSAVSSAPAYPIPILWKVYARYLRVEASINPEKPEERGSARTEP